MRLRILISPTCVGLQYGLLFLIGSGFSWHRLQEDRFGRSRPSATFSRHYPSIRASPVPRRLRNINLIAIAYALRPRLRTRLTLGRRTLPRKPWVYGGQEFHLPYRYLCLHTHFSALHLQSPSGFNALRTLLYHSFESRASVYRLSPIIFGARTLDE